MPILRPFWLWAAGLISWGLGNAHETSTLNLHVPVSTVLATYPGFFWPFGEPSLAFSSAAMLSTNRDCSKYMSFVLLDDFLFARIEVRIGVRNEELHRAVAIFKYLNCYPSQSLCCDSGKYYRTSMVPNRWFLSKGVRYLIVSYLFPRKLFERNNSHNCLF